MVFVEVWSSPFIIKFKIEKLNESLSITNAPLETAILFINIIYYFYNFHCRNHNKKKVKFIEKNGEKKFFFTGEFSGKKRAALATMHSVNCCTTSTKSKGCRLSRGIFRRFFSQRDYSFLLFRNLRSM